MAQRLGTGAPHRRRAPNYIVQPCVRSQFRPTPDGRLVVRPSRVSARSRSSWGALFSSAERRVTRQISRPISFPRSAQAPTWTLPRRTRSGQLRAPWRLRWMGYACAFPSACVQLGEIGARISSAAQM
jgi:hypothetical protein